MTELTYNNAKNVSIGYTSFKLNYGYHLRLLYKEEVNSHSKSKSIDELSAELRELMIICQKNLCYAQKFQKQARNKGVKPQSYASNNKILLNNKYIKIKHNCSLEVKFFRPFQMPHPVGKQAYKLEFLKK